MTGKLKVGIAGYGVVGQRRRQVIDAHPRLETVAVCDRRLTVNGEKIDGVVQYQHYKDLLREKLDVLFVCLTNDVAAEVVIVGDAVAIVDRAVAAETETIVLNPEIARLAMRFVQRSRLQVRKA